MSAAHETGADPLISSDIGKIRPTNLWRRLQADDQGRLIPRTEAERVEDHQALLRAFAEMDAIPDDPPGSDEELWRAIDEARPEWPLFRQYYES